MEAYHSGKWAKIQCNYNMNKNNKVNKIIVLNIILSYWIGTSSLSDINELRLDFFKKRKSFTSSV